MTVTSEIIANSQWQKGYSILQRGDVFEVAFQRLDDAIACKEILSSQFIFTDECIISGVVQILTYYQLSIQTIGWLETDKQNLLRFDFSRQGRS